jgi:hypothetical protein
MIKVLKIHVIMWGILILASPNSFAANFTVHEWGTFTSLQDSRGKLLNGIYHEDEALPDFVYGRDQFSKIHYNSKSLIACWGMPGPCKRVEPTPSGTLLAANEKLETPVIYFYSEEPLTALIEVSFPGGIISQWFPNAARYSPPVDQIQTLSEGKMSWKVDILTDSSPSLAKISEGSIWAPSREVNSNPIRVGSEIEKFIFYRGLGKFDVPVRTLSSKAEMILSNLSPEVIDSAFVLEYTGESGSWVPLGRVPSQRARVIKFSDIKARRQPISTYLAQISKSLEEALVHSGLYRDEASAMVRTWANSYFNRTFPEKSC